MVPDSDLLPISGLQHMVYCPRQCGLIHVDREWQENRFTAEGRVLHERIDSGGEQKKSGVRLRYSLSVKSRTLGVSGVCDLVEFHRSESGERLVPVETKRGKSKSIDADRIQLCAQALCLEEMFETEIPEGALFYATPRRRETVAFDAALRTRTTETTIAFHEMMEAGRLPAPIYSKVKCDRCSLFGVCQPKAKSVSKWIEKRLKEVP